MGRGQEDTVFVFDEPTIGLHPLDVRTLLQVFETLIRQGATVVVIEHDLDVIRNADYIIDMGPGGGEEGGRIVAQGTPEQIAGCGESLTGPLSAVNKKGSHPAISAGGFLFFFGKIGELVRLEPAGLGHLVLEGDGALEHVAGLDQALVLAHQAVLMLDGQDIVVAHQAQLADEILPEQLVVAVADGAENPGAVQLVAVGAVIQGAVDGGVDGVNLGVLGMDVEDCLAAQGAG